MYMNMEYCGYKYINICTYISHVLTVIIAQIIVSGDQEVMEVIQREKLLDRLIKELTVRRLSGVLLQSVLFYT